MVSPDKKKIWHSLHFACASPYTQMDVVASDREHLVKVIHGVLDYIAAHKWEELFTPEVVTVLIPEYGAPLVVIPLPESKE
jgi:hypothetical protein